MGAPKTVTEDAVDRYLSNVESLLIALSQRGITDAQIDRLAGILQRAELSLLERSTISAAKGCKRVHAA